MSEENKSSVKPEAAAAPAKPKRRWLRLLLKLFVVAVVLLALLVALAPTIASATFLTGTVRGQLQTMFGQGANVGAVSVGWLSGLSLGELTLPPGPKAVDTKRPPVTLDKLDVDVSIPGAAVAALTGGQTNVTVSVGRLKVYFEQGKDGSNLQGIGEPAPGAGKKPEAAPGDKKPEAKAPPAKKEPLPCAAQTTVKVESIDVTFVNYKADPPQRITIDRLKVGLLAKVARDGSLLVEKVDVPQAVAFDAIKVEKLATEPGKPDTLVIAIERPKIDLMADVAPEPPADAATVAPPGLEGALAVRKAAPDVGVARIHGVDFDLRDLKTTVDFDGKARKLALGVAGILKGMHEGKLGLKLTATFKSRNELPVDMDFSLEEVDISGMVAKQIPKLLPLLDGATTDKGSEHLPRLTFKTSGKLAALWKKDESGVDTFNMDDTLKAVAANGELKLGPGKFEGSKILAGYMKAIDDLGVRDVIDKLTGGPLDFEGLTESFVAKDGTLTIPKLALASKKLGLSLDGQVGLVTQEYTFGMHLDESVYGRVAPDVAKLLRSIDEAGGIKVKGKVGGECAVTHPPFEDLAKAAIKGGAIDLWRTRGGATAHKLDAAIQKAGLGSLEKIADDPKKAAEEAAKQKAEEEAKKQAEGKLGRKIQEKTGIDPSKLLPGAGDKKPAEGEKKDEKKDEGLEKFIPKNPFGVGGG